MNQLIDEAKRQFELEQSYGAISDYFAAMNSIMNAFHEQQNSVKRNDNDEEETIDTKSKSEKQEQNQKAKKMMIWKNHLKILTPNKNTKSRMNKSFKLLQNLHIYQQKFK